MRFNRFLFCLAIPALTLTPPSPVSAQVLDGPVKAQVLRVIDGDTFVAGAMVWPGQTIVVNVRIRGIDTAEIRSECPAERLMAKRAREALAAMISDRYVSISRIGGGKYYGRVLANVTAPDGTDVGARLLGSMLAHPYDPKSRHWACKMK